MRLFNLQDIRTFEDALQCFKHRFIHIILYVKLHPHFAEALFAEFLYNARLQADLNAVARQ